MAVRNLTEGDDVFTSNLVPQGPETANSIQGLGGDDDITGNGFADFINGGDGDDVIDGAGNNDNLLGFDGNDVLEGGAGNDFLNGDNIDNTTDNGVNNNDVLYGGTGSDDLRGGIGNDDYVYFKSDGSIDTINEDLSAAGDTGFGGGNDWLFFEDVILNDVQLFQFGQDLHITDTADTQDGFIDTGVTISSFFDGGDNVVEVLVDANDQTLNLVSLVA